MEPNERREENEGRLTVWRRGSRCASGSCVEVAQIGEQIAVRDSKSLDSSVLTYSREEWQTFVDGVKAGEFDLD